MFFGKHFSCSANTTLNFIENQHNILFITKGSQRFKENFIHNINAAFPLNRFYNDCCGIVVGSFFYSFYVVKSHLKKSLRNWLKSFLICFFTRGNRCQCTSVKGVFKRNDIPSPSNTMGIFTCNFNSTLYRFRSAIREKHPIQA